MAINKEMDKQNVVHPSNGVLHIKRRKGWMNLKKPLERSQLQKSLCYRIPLTGNVQNRQIHTERLVIVSGGVMGVTASEYGFSFGGMVMVMVVEKFYN